MNKFNVVQRVVYAFYEHDVVDEDDNYLDFEVVLPEDPHVGLMVTVKDVDRMASTGVWVKSENHLMDEYHNGFELETDGISISFIFGPSPDPDRSPMWHIV